jgi:MoxR-like ATPase
MLWVGVLAGRQLVRRPAPVVPAAAWILHQANHHPSRWVTTIPTAELQPSQRHSITTVTATPSPTAASPAIIGTVQRMRAALDRNIIGHGNVKTAVLLALLAREHVYIEGPPGVGKTMVAEVAAKTVSLRFFFYQMHRDTRLQELVGDAVIHREARTGTRPGEVIRQRVSPGGILQADVCVLDDISRAPGEALNVLLRILNERKFGLEPIPLVTAIATGNPTGDGYYTEPLDPGVHDLL